MNKKNIYIIIAILVLFLAGFLYFKNVSNKSPENSGITSSGEEVVIKDVRPGDLDQNTADPVLTGKQWEWKEAYINEGDKIVNPVDSKNFILSFVKGNKFSTTTDCNKLMGTYTLEEKSLKMKDIASTRMECEDPYAQEQAYSSMLASSDSYFFRDDGSLIIMMEEDKGTMTFAPTTESVE